MTTILTTDQVEITTATIQIHTMRVGQRQVTQALFRQLPALAWDSLKPESDTVWGTVRYGMTDNVSSDTDSQSDVWAVVERNGVLYRVPVARANYWIPSGQARGRANSARWDYQRTEEKNKLYASTSHVDEVLPDLSWIPSYLELAEWVQRQCKSTPQLFIAV